MTLIDCESIVRLLKSGFSYQDTLTLLKDKHNAKVFAKIHASLALGNPLNTTILPYLPKVIRNDVSSYAQFLSFENALDLSMRLYQQHKTTLDAAIKILFYPLLLLLGTIVGMYLFNITIFPTIIDLLHHFVDDTALYESVHTILTVICILTVIGVICGLVVGFVVKRYPLTCYVRFQKLIQATLLQKFITVKFIQYFKESYEIGMSTKDTILLLTQLDNAPIIQYIAKHIHTAFLQGEPFHEAMSNQAFDASLTKFIQIAMYSSSLEDMLKNYLERTHIKIQHELKQIARILQLVVYGAIGILVVFLYQILFLPLQAITNI